MKKFIAVSIVFSLVLFFTLGCISENSSSEKTDRQIVTEQQQHYQRVQPVPFFEYSIPRDVYTQIYEVVVTEAYNTYTVIQSMTGEVVYHGRSVGYAIPNDVSFTNPYQPEWRGTGQGRAGVTLGQAEPDGLFASTNTDGTWVLYLQDDGSITPVYTEQKVTVYPYDVEMNEEGIWVPVDTDTEFTIEIND